MQKSNLKFIFFLFFLLLAWLLGRFFIIENNIYENFFRNLPLGVSAVVFIFLYVCITFFAWAAKDVFKIIGAYVFGAYLSAFFIWLAEMGNAFIFFHFSRHCGREFVQKRFSSKVSSLDRYMDRSGFWGIFIVRAFPIIPFRVLDLAVGLTSIQFFKYFLLVMIASPVRIFWVQFILAGVGRSFLREPQILTDFLHQNPLAFRFSLGYFIASVIAIILYRRKERMKHD